MFRISYFNSPFLQWDIVFLSGKALDAISHPLLQLSGVLCCQLECGRCCPVTHTFSFTLCWALRLVLVLNKAHWRCHWAWIFINGAGFLSPHISLNATLGDTSQWNIVLSSFIMHKTISSPSSLCFTVDLLILCWLIHGAEFSFPVKDLGRSSHLDSVQTVLREARSHSQCSLWCSHWPCWEAGAAASEEQRISSLHRLLLVTPLINCPPRRQWDQLFQYCPGHSDPETCKELPAFLQLARNLYPSGLSGETSQCEVWNAASEMPALSYLLS